MEKLNSTMAQQVAQAISIFQEQWTGCPANAVTLVLSDATLVVTLHEVLSPTEIALCRTPEGAVQVQEYHQQLFKDSVDLLRQKIELIIGVAVREAAVEMKPSTGATVHAFTTGTMVRALRLAGTISAGVWNESGPGDESHSGA